MISRLALLSAAALLLLPAAGAQPAEGGNFQLNAVEMSYDANTGESVASGHASLRDGGRLLTADEIRYNSRTETATAIGRVVLTRELDRLLADRLVYHRRDATFTAENLRVGRFPFYIQGRTAEGGPQQIAIHDATLSYNEPSRWQPTIRAETIIYSPRHFVRLIHAWLGLNDSKIVPVPHFTQTFTEALSLPSVTASGGYQSSLGATANIGLRVPVDLSDYAEVRAGADIGVYTDRGLMAGPGFNYQSSDGSGDLLGSFHSGYIHDYGIRGVDILGDPVPTDREYIEWQHQQQVTDDLTLDADVNWWSDSYVLRDFQPRAFEAVQEPDNYAEAVYTGGDYLASVFTRFQPDTFEPVQERLPEVRYDLVPTAIGLGVIERFDASAVSLLERPPDDGPELGSHRLDGFYELSRPWAPTPWFTFTPVAGLRVTNYSDTIGAAVPGGDTRVLDEVGFDAALRSSGDFDYKNAVWDIDGLRHLFTPYLSYRYISGTGVDPDRIPDIDSTTYSTYLQPLDLGDSRAVDELGPADTLRIGVDNTLQTRDPVYGSRDLADWSLAEDFLFQDSEAAPTLSSLEAQRPGRPVASLIQSQLDLMPADWLQFNSLELVEPEVGGLSEFESGLSLKDGDLWWLTLRSDWVTREDDEYFAEWHIAVNESYAPLFRVDYDAREHRFDRIEVGLDQVLANTWKVEYVMTFNSGPNRAGHFGLNAQVDVVRF